MLCRPRQRIGRHAVQRRRGRPLAAHARVSLRPADHQRLAHARRPLRIREGAWGKIPVGDRCGVVRAELPHPVRRVQQARAAPDCRLGRSLMAFFRSLLFAAIFYPATVLWVLVGVIATWFGRRPTLAVVLSWVELNHWVCEHVLGIRSRVIGEIPPGPHLIAVKHQSMFETLEMVRLSKLPVMVMKKELADIPLFGLMTRRYGVIAV